MALLGIDKPEIVFEIVVLLAAKLPSNAPTVPVVTGEEKSNELTSIQVPLLIAVAFVLYWKSNRSALPVAPNLHCSPVYCMDKLVTVAPVLFIKVEPAPILEFKVPENKVPNALSDVVPKL